jgi:hypothetical protein
MPEPKAIVEAAEYASLSVAHVLARNAGETRVLPLYVGGKAKNRAYKPEPKKPYSKDCHDEN